jgi:plasmid maintenance system antidote protein VapI
MSKTIAPVSPGEMLQDEFLAPLGMRFFGLSDGWWLRLQVSYDTTIAKWKMSAELAKIVPLGHAA